MMNEAAFDTLVRRPAVAKEFGISTRSIKRWQEAGLPGLDAPIVIRGNVYYRRADVERAKAGRATAAA
jgi:hypothetical protein